MTTVWIALVIAACSLATVGAVLVVLLRRPVAPAQVSPDERAALVATIEGDVAARLRHDLEGREAQLARQVEELQDRQERFEREQQEHRAQLAAEQARLATASTELDHRLAQAEELRAGAREQKQQADRTREAAESHALQERADLRALRQQLDERERRIGEREERLVLEGQTLEARSTQLVELRDHTERLRAELEDQQGAMHQEHARELARLQAELERVAALDRDQARAEVLARAEHDARLEATALARDIEQEAVRTAETRARRTIVTAIQRLAAEQTAESVVSTLDLPGDEMKGRIIGREGRNIRHFEQVTGVNVMIDDTPGSVLLSCFDPVRREVARLTLAELVADGRIHPARIEEVYERSHERVEQQMVRAAEDALAEVGISDLDPALVPVLGALRYRTSYGQNVLRHLVECSHLAGMMAAELGLDVASCSRAAFLHDIGKALTHEVEGTHAMVGAELARRHGERPEIVHAIAAHHNEVEPTTVEAVLTQAADAISGSRPGARRESLEAYVHRLERLEQIAAAHDGVDRVFAMQAGREVRVMVAPEVVDDATSHAMAREIAREIQDELTYPGQIRVTVVRESRATEVAH